MWTDKQPTKCHTQLSPANFLLCATLLVLLSISCVTHSPSRSPAKGQTESSPDNDVLKAVGHGPPVPEVTCKLRHDPFEDECPEPHEGGAWEGVFPAKGSAAIYNILGMQTVHATMLPSGRILLVSGSSWRNRNGTEYFPTDCEGPIEECVPETPNGLFIRDEDPFRNAKLDEYYELVNNAAIYDPVNNTFYRVPVPVPEPDPGKNDHFAPNDFFCTGHQHLRV